MDWTQSTTAARPTYVMDGDQRYTVERWGLGSWQAYFHGNRINPDHQSLGTAAEAQRFAEAHRNSPEQRIARAVKIIEDVQAAREARGASRVATLDLVLAELTDLAP